MGILIEALTAKYAAQAPALPVEAGIRQKSELDPQTNLALLDADEMDSHIAELLDGREKAGLLVAPVFLNREGRGSGRDKSHNIKAQVVFYNDQLPATPFVQILGIQRVTESEWGDGLKLVNCVAALDCYTNQFMPNSITPRAVTARTTQDVLGNFVEAMVRNEKCMAHWGFTDVTVSPSAPHDLTDKDGLPWTFHYPLQVSFEIYAENPYG